MHAAKAVYTDKSIKSIVTQLTIFKKQLLITLDYIESVAKDLEYSPHKDNMSMSNYLK